METPESASVTPPAPAPSTGSGQAHAPDASPGLLTFLWKGAAAVWTRLSSSKKSDPDEVEAKCSIQRVKTDNYRLAGTLETLSFELVVQALSAAWQTGVFIADCSGKIAKIYFEKGCVTSARFGTLTRADAFNQLYRQSAGHFLFQPGKIAPQKDMNEPVIPLLLGAARASDEHLEPTIHPSLRPASRVYLPLPPCS